MDYSTLFAVDRYATTIFFTVVQYCKPMLHRRADGTSCGLTKELFDFYCFMECEECFGAVMLPTPSDPLLSQYVHIMYDDK